MTRPSQPSITGISFLSFFKTMIQSFKWHIGTLLFIAAYWSFDLSIRPYIVKIILDRLSTTAPSEAISALAFPVALYFILAVVVLVIFRFYDIIHLKLMPNLRKKVIAYMMDHMLEHSHSYYQNYFTGGLSNKINDVANGMREIITIGIDRFFGNALALIIATLTIAIVHPILSYILLAWVILFVGVSLMCAKKAHRLSDELSDINSSITGKIVDILTNMPAVRFFNGKRQEKDNLNEWTKESVEKEQTLNWFLFKLWIFQGFSFMAMETASILFLMYGRKNGFITVGDFGLILTINIHIIEYMWNLSKDFTDFTEHLGKITQGLRLTTSSIEITDAPGAQLLKVNKGEIRFENVLFHYKSDIPLFSNLSVTIPGGQKVGLVGFSGSGKSTFANLILRLYNIHAGRICIDNQDIASVTQESLRENIAMIPQDPILFHRSLLENIRYGKREASDEEVFAAAQKAHVNEFISKLSYGFNSMVGERGVKLSGGQRQRIALARAILKNAPILILDEATSALDSVTEQTIQETLFELMEHKTTLVIAHRLSTLLYMDRILVFDKGSIVEEGSHEELLEKQGLYSKLWEAQVSGFLPEYYDDDEEEDESEEA
jgi:ATP-binding cassette subfamily B protein